MLKKLRNYIRGLSGSVGECEPVPRSRVRARLGVEMLEDRVVLAVIDFVVNTTDDTPLDQAIFNELGEVVTVVDVNGNTSLRAVVQYANANPQNGDWNFNRYNVELKPIRGGTITLNSAGPFQTLGLNTNFNIFNNAPDDRVTIERSAADDTPAFNHITVLPGREVHFLGITFHNGKTDFDGGSILNRGRAEFLECSFTYNTSVRSGGAIANLADGTILVSNCKFTNNTAQGLTQGGGAIAALEESWVTNIDGCTFSDNKAENGNGGAIWAKGAGSLQIANSTISKNKALGPVNAEGRGGGVYVENVTAADISQTVIEENEANWRGGGLYVLDCNLTMTGGQLFNNISGGHGGGFFIDAGTSNTVTLNQVAITDNKSTGGRGGGGYVRTGTLAGQLLMGQLTGNTATNVGFNGTLPGIGIGIGAIRTITIAPGQQKAENDQ